MAKYNYLGNKNLVGQDYVHEYTEWEWNEWLKCARDPIYFIKNYVRIIHIDKGLVPFELWKFQEDFIHTIHNNRYVIAKFPRQTGKSTTTIAYLLHYILFNQHVKVALLSNKASGGRELLSRLKLAFEYLPIFLKQGIIKWNEGSIHLANGSKIFAGSTTSSGIRGESVNIVVLDEFAHIPPGISEKFFQSTYPVISAGQTSRTIIISTPLGLNKFYEMWTEAVEGKSLYVPSEVAWNDVPGRDEKWRDDQIRNMGYEKFAVEFECAFQGSAPTLISTKAIIEMKDNIKGAVAGEEPKYRIFELPKPDREYVICVDTARGLGGDYSAFSVIDISEIPYRQVATYRDNTISSMVYPSKIMQAAREYNNAYVLVEINDIGQQVSDILQHDLEYEYLFKFRRKNNQQVFSAGFTRNVSNGVRTTQATKRVGCSNLKTLIESKKLIIQDKTTYEEIKTFVENGQSFAAEEGRTDDLVMTLVLFGWLNTTKYFKDNLSKNLRETIEREYEELHATTFTPFGFINDAAHDHSNIHVDGGGQVWEIVQN